ncbi:hypothetical protein GCM10009579_02110 [Streptomyces javensis]|uniref:Uncharacterized protein n=1 Tax=Streptomyces javensis TaxID=114698 RepID=A0ABN1WIM8_9ACTN
MGATQHRRSCTGQAATTMRNGGLKHAFALPEGGNDYFVRPPCSRYMAQRGGEMHELEERGRARAHGPAAAGQSVASRVRQLGIEGFQSSTCRMRSLDAPRMAIS